MKSKMSDMPSYHRLSRLELYNTVHHYYARLAKINSRKE